MQYLRIMEQILNRPMLATPELMASAMAFAQMRLGLVVASTDVEAAHPARPTTRVRIDSDPDGDPDDDDDDDDDSGAADDDCGVAQILVHGPLVSRTGNLKMCQSMTAYESIDAQIAGALADPSITRILLDIDSNGGTATGGFETAARIRAANAIKPVTALVHFSAFSGGYLLACAAGEISVSQSSGVGSIGVIARHADVSKMNEAMGIAVTSIYRGDHKNDLSPDEPLTDSARAFLQANVDRVYGQFVQTVAQYRSINQQAVVDTQAGLFFGQQALDVGLADRLETPQDAMNRLAAAAAQDRVARVSMQAPQMDMRRMRMVAQAADIATRL